MQIKKSFLLVIFLSISISSYSYEYLDPKNEPEKFEEKGINDLVAKHTGERIVFRDSNLMADSIVFSVKSFAKDVQGELVEIIKNRDMSILLEEDFINEEYSRLTTGYEGESFKYQIDDLKSKGVNLYRFEQYRIKVKYNVIKEIKGHSELEVNIIDGENIFGKVCTLIVMKRIDYWQDWPREWHTGIRIKLIKVPAEGNIITETEIKMIEELKIRLGMEETSYFFSESSYYPLLDLKMMEKVKEEVDKF